MLHQTGYKTHLKPDHFAKNDAKLMTLRNKYNTVPILQMKTLNFWHRNFQDDNEWQSWDTHAWSIRVGVEVGTEGIIN